MSNLDVHSGVGPSADAAETLVKLCGEFQHAWRSGARPSIEEWLAEIPQELRRDAERRLIPLEMELRHEAGLAVDGQEFGTRFPHQVAVVERALRQLAAGGCASSSWLDQMLAAQDTEAAGTTLAPLDPAQIPARLGPYTIERQLGTGSFGVVFLAWDAERDRSVAVKLPRANSAGGGTTPSATLLDEARTAQELKHPGIVETLDVISQSDLVCIVQQWIDGETLETLFHRPPPLRSFIELMEQVARAVAYANSQGFVHRDLKPSNILVDRTNHAYVSDFGLALHTSVQQWHVGETIGTPAYRSPELVRGESHRTDGRSDIWSLGVILYRFLVGRLPFFGATPAELSDAILHREPIPPRQIKPDLPAALERICMICLRKRISERYPSAADLADDLRRWLDARSENLPNRGAAPIVPQGLRPFGADDAEFFLRLLPGPRDVENLPLSLRFWKHRIDPAARTGSTFPVGVIYGPSGCGKSSFLKAGLLPRLSGQVVPIYVEASATDTELRLEASLRRLSPAIPATANLVEIVDGLRRGRWIPGGKKILLVLDQFEQWLFAQSSAQASALTAALRHFDGVKLQALITVRDDFWLAIARFMRAIDVDLVDGQNVLLLDLFDLDHARNVLIEMGQAYQRLPADRAAFTREHESFLDAAISGLAEGQRVVCIRLAVFAEAFKNRPWTPAQLKAVGGISGAGEMFLEETFSARFAPARTRRHQSAVQAVFETLLPATASVIRGPQCSRDALLVASSYANQPERFDELLRILDGELRLITPVEPNPSSPEPTPDDHAPQQCYQLTHDYLVPSIRAWLTKNEEATWRGRARIRLAELADLWNTARDRRYLPTLPEFASIAAGVPRRSQSVAQRDYLWAATSYYARRFGALALLLGAVIVGATWFRNDALQRKAQEELARFAEVSPAGVPAGLERLQGYEGQLTRLVSEKQQFGSSREALRYLLLRAEWADPNKIPAGELVAFIPKAEQGECANLVRPLRLAASARNHRELLDRLWELTQATPDDETAARYASILLHLGDPRGAAHCLRCLPDPDRRTTFIHSYDQWHGDLLEVIQLLERADDPQLVSGLCKALGRIQPHSLSNSERQSLQHVCTHLFATHPDAAVHSSAEWVLRQLDAPIPELIDATAPTDAQWMQRRLLGRHTMTFVRIPAGTVPLGAGLPPTLKARSVDSRHQRIERPFWLATTETSTALFRQFVEEEASPATRETIENSPEFIWASDERLPVCGVTYFEAIEFCNWLSRQEGHDEAYVFSGDEWRLVENASGYRLPTSEEWELACRAGTTTAFPFGEESQLTKLEEYGWCLDVLPIPSIKVGYPAHDLPNDYGLFDMIGNAWELTGTTITPQFGDESSLVDARGGGAHSSLDSFFSGGYAPYLKDRRFLSAGFRIMFRETVAD